MFGRQVVKTNGSWTGACVMERCPQRDLERVCVEYSHLQNRNTGESFFQLVRVSHTHTQTWG